jgi:hypothetical protein
MYDDPEIIDIDTVSLDDLLQMRQFSLILMDIEGSEYFALKGMQKILAGSKALSVEFLPYHLRDVANVEILDFINTILPHFEWMYIPRYNSIFEKAEISKKVEEMYRAGECHEGIYFLKKLPQDWLKERG